MPDQALTAILHQLEQQRSGIHLGLDRIKQAAQALDCLSLPCQVITVAGTNGKGSVVAALVSIYQQAGYQVGSYTSPHLIHFNERYQINGQPVDKARLLAVFTQIHPLCQQYDLSYFESTTLAALYLFKHSPLDVVILEVGLGGRLDAVNVMDADIAVITSIDFDHTDVLGDDLDTIAREKAGIMRAGQAVISGAHNCQAVLQKCAQAAQANFYPAKTAKTTASITTPLLPCNQAIARTVIECNQAVMPVNMFAMQAGLERVRLPGRYQKIHKQCLHILDVAHNPASCQQLAQRLQAEHRDGQIVVVGAMLADKDMQSAWGHLAPLVATWHLAPLACPRAAAVDQMQAALMANAVAGSAIYHYDDLQQAYRSVLAHISPDDILLITGSFFVVGELLANLIEK